MTGGLSERDRRLVSRLRSKTPASFRLRRILGLVLLVLALVLMGVVVPISVYGSPGQASEGGTVYSLCCITLVVFMLADIVGERARLHRIIHCLADKDESEGSA